MYGDWAESPKAGAPHAWSTGDECPRALVEHGTFIECLDRGADLAQLAGEPAQAAQWREMAARARGSRRRAS